MLARRFQREHKQLLTMKYHLKSDLDTYKQKSTNNKAFWLAVLR